MTLMLPHLGIAFLVNGILASAAYAGKLVSRSGAVGGFAVGVLIYFFTDWRGYVVLLSFFALGTLVTKVKYSEKEKKGIAQEDKGRRGAKHAFANCAAGLILGCIGWIISVMAGRTGFDYGLPAAGLLAVGFAGSFATALSDTASSELGQAFGRTAILLTSLKKVPPGTEGAVSVEGTLAGLAAGCLIAALAWASGVVSGFGAFLAVSVAAFIGNTLESIIGSTIERLPFVTNEVTNFLNTVIGAVTAMALYMPFR